MTHMAHRKDEPTAWHAPRADAERQSGGLVAVGPAPSPAWHSRTPAEVATTFGTDLAKGLSWQDVERLDALRPASKAQGSWVALRILVNQLKGGVIVVLLAATAVSWLMGHRGDAIGIGASVLFSIFFGFLTDFRAERALAALKTLSARTARAIREGLEHEIPARAVHVGDVVVLAAGQVLAADGRLFDVRDLQIDESLLTGESLPVDKQEGVLARDAALADRRNMAFNGTTAVNGYGRMLVTAVGEETELGRIGRLVLEEEKEETPLERQAEQLGRQLALLVVGLSAVTTILGLLRDRPLGLMIETGVILAIAAIPEGLPAVTTVALAAGVRRMAQARCLVRRLSSVETLGSVSVICTDKTGTLTENMMRVTTVILPSQALTISGAGYGPEGDIALDGHRVDPRGNEHLRRLLETGALCNNARLESHDGWHVHGSSTEGALLALATKGGVELAELSQRFRRISEQGFSSDRKRMSVISEDLSGRFWSFVKGSPEVLLSRCTDVLSGVTPTPLSPEERSRLLEQGHSLGNSGHRVLALAFRSLPSVEAVQQAEEGLTWIGLVGIMDPPRTGVREAIAALRDAGIRTVMVTGDQKTTAAAIAAGLGLLEPGDICLDSIELARYVSERRWEDLHRTAVFARVTPSDKLAIVKALKAAGQYVAMTGDGINDAPAMKAADIGIAIGSKSADIAKESADLVVTDADYGSLPAAVAEGRQIYMNIRRAVQFLLLCSFSTIWVMLFSVLTNLALPMNPLQILWLNLAVHIFPGIALALVPGETGLMRRPPRNPLDRLLSWKQTAIIAAKSLVVAGAALWVYTNEHETGHLTHAHTLVMATLATSLLLQMFAGLSEREPFFRMGRCLRPVFWFALAGGLAIQALAIYWPFLAGILQTIPLSLQDWSRVLVVSLAALALVEVAKAGLPRLRMS
jgi:P-type Ca2+ transporter type 2C